MDIVQCFCILFVCCSRKIGINVNINRSEPLISLELKQNDTTLFINQDVVISSIFMRLLTHSFSLLGV